MTRNTNLAGTLPLIALMAVATGCTSPLSLHRGSALGSHQLKDASLCYFLAHASVVAESSSGTFVEQPWPHFVFPTNSYLEYRIWSYTAPGDCVNGCPPSAIIVTTWDSMHSEDGELRVFKLEGLQYCNFIRVEDDFGNEDRQKFFMSFIVRSLPHPNKPVDYLVRVSRRGMQVDFYSRLSHEFDIQEAVIRYQTAHLEWLTNVHAYYLSLPKDADPPLELISRVANITPQVHTRTECVEKSPCGVIDKRNGEHGVMIQIRAIEWTSDCEVEVTGGYSDGWSAASSVYTVRKVTGRWNIVNERQL